MIETDATSPLSDLLPLAVIVDDVSATVKKGDLAGGKARVKDLEVAWDSAEAAMQPASLTDWHTLASAIDDVLTSLRATPPSAATCTAALTAMPSVIATIEHQS